MKPSLSTAVTASILALGLGFGAAAMLRKTRRLPPPAPPPDPTAKVNRNLLLYFIIPLWTSAGVADWLCHRATGIERTTGAKESVIHLLMLGEMAVPLLAVLLLEVTSPVLALMIAAFLIHEGTALWDVSYAVTRREVRPIEQHVHSFLELVPLMALLVTGTLHWREMLALAGLGDRRADWSLRRKAEPLPAGYLTATVGSMAVLEALPYLEELWRGLKANDGRLVPEPRTVRAPAHRA